MRHRKCTADRRGDRYIEGEKGQTKTHQAREVRDWASSDCSRKTDKSLGMDLTQKKKKRLKECQVGNGYRCQKCVDKTQGSQRVWECIAKT